MRKLIPLITTLAVVGTAGYAVAAPSGTVTASVSPNTPNAGSSVQATASNFTSGSGLPSKLVITVQKGFTTAVDKRNRADSVKVLCTPTQEQNDSCPAESRIGQGQADATISGPVPGEAVSQDIQFVMFLGEAPAGSTCPASVEIVFKAGAQTPSEHAIGTLCKYLGGLQLTFDNLPTYSSIIPSGFTATLNKLTFGAGASTTTKVTTKKTVRRHGKRVTVKSTRTIHNYLLNNPGSCPSSGSWTGTLAVTFQSGTDTQPLSLACRP